MSKVYRICPRCHKEYCLGSNGIANSCDECAGVERDQYGCAWLPGEEQHTYTQTMTREQAFDTPSRRLRSFVARVVKR